MGEAAANVRKALDGFDHKFAHRNFKWDTAQGLWTKDFLNLFSEEKKEHIAYFQELFDFELNEYQKLRKAVIHNDINDNNIIVSKDAVHPIINGIIDFGDAIYTQVINELGTCCAYAIMHCENPLEAAREVIEGYHRKSVTHVKA